VIINLDSRQIYRDFPIITAQPSAKDQALYPHLLYGCLATAEKLGAGEYARLAQDVILKTLDNGGLPLLVGGAGLYLDALLKGMAPIPEIPPEISAHWQEECAAKGSPALHALLTEHDPLYASRIHPNDRQRVARALEVWKFTGKTFSWWHAQPVAAPLFQPIKVGVSLPLAELEPMLNVRIEDMLTLGAVEEARTALEHCPDPDAPGWSGIGCNELLQYLTGRLTFEECLNLWRHNTRAYAKRQNTWFRADAEITWFAPSQGEDLVEYVLEHA
jgi:tRNA dimethylallyltransferase